MRDRTASPNYSPARDEFRREHERHRAWGLMQRHGQRLRRLRNGSCAIPAASPHVHRPPDPTRPSPSAPVSALVEQRQHPTPSGNTPTSQESARRRGSASPSACPRRPRNNSRDLVEPSRGRCPPDKDAAARSPLYPPSPASGRNAPAAGPGRSRYRVHRSQVTRPAALQLVPHRDQRSIIETPRHGCMKGTSESPIPGLRKHSDRTEHVTGRPCGRLSHRAPALHSTGCETSVRIRSPPLIPISHRPERDSARSTRPRWTRGRAGASATVPVDPHRAGSGAEPGAGCSGGPSVAWP